MIDLDSAILKTLISNKKCALDFIESGDAKFFSPEMWNFANVVITYLRTYKELPTQRVLIEKLSKKNSKLPEYVKKIWDQLDKIEYNDKEYKHDLERLKKRYAEKQIAIAGENIAKLEAGNMDISQAINTMHKTIASINELNNNKTYESKNIKDYLPSFVERFNAKKNNPKLDKGILTGYSFFDYATNGSKPADFVIIAGETGFGKSVFLGNIAAQVWLQDNKEFMQAQGDFNFNEGKNIIFFSLEMPYEDCFNRLLSRLSGVPTRQIENAKLSKENFEKVKKALDFIDKYPYQFKIVDIVDATANDIEAIMINSGEKYDAIFIDYLGIMRPNEKNDEQDWLKQGTISYEVRAIARKYKVPVFSAVQLNRKASGKEPAESIGLHRLARSGTIATHLTHIVQIENRPNEDKYPDFIYHFIKNRKGPKGKGMLIKNLACATLLDKCSEEKPNDDDEMYDKYFTDQDDLSKEIDDLEL